MIKDRSELEDAIEQFMRLHFTDKDVTDKIKKYMTQKNYTLGEINMFINLNSPPMTLNDTDLGVLSASVTYSGGFDYKEYWQPDEIEGIDNYYKDNTKERTKKIVFEQAVKLTENQYLTHATIPQLVQWLQDDHIITYNPNIQRELIRKVNKKGELIESIHLNRTKQHKIARRIVNKQQYGDTLFFNLLNNGIQKEPIYDELNHTITVEFTEDTQFAIIDGFHRLMGATSAYGMDDSVKLIYGIIVTFLDESHAGDLVQQEDLHTPIKKSKAKLLGTSNPYLQLAKAINNFGNEVDNELYHKFGEDEYELSLKPNSLLCTYDTFAQAIEYNFFANEKPTAREIQHVREFIINGFNELIGIYKEKYGDTIQEIKKNGLQLYHNMFIGYITILAHLYKENNKEWREALELILTDIDFNENNKTWKTINLFAPKISKNVIKKISSYFIERSVL